MTDHSYVFSMNHTVVYDIIMKVMRQNVEKWTKRDLRYMNSTLRLHMSGKIPEYRLHITKHVGCHNKMISHSILYQIDCIILSYDDGIKFQYYCQNTNKPMIIDRKKDPQHLLSWFLFWVDPTKKPIQSIFDDPHHYAFKFYQDIIADSIRDKILDVVNYSDKERGISSDIYRMMYRMALSSPPAPKLKNPSQGEIETNQSTSSNNTDTSRMEEKGTKERPKRATKRARTQEDEIMDWYRAFDGKFHQRFIVFHRTSTGLRTSKVSGIEHFEIDNNDKITVQPSDRNAIIKNVEKISII
jgi:hypothetical protein